MLALCTLAIFLLVSILPFVNACDWGALATVKAGPYICGQRIDWLKSICGSCSDGGGGGATCASAWHAPVTDKAGTYTCGDRITWLQTFLGISES